ncbi:MAG: uracil-DNA glycosylase [Candidatus Paceibacterota bacterium]|jgi:uracil-DNA glycosylase
MEVKIEKSWKSALQDEFGKEYFKTLTGFVRAEYKNGKVYPPAKFIFRAFELTPFDKVRVVILGQDPYHGPGQAHGLSFSVPEGIGAPPSLQNIYKELEADLGKTLGRSSSKSGNLEHWAGQGVLLLNATLTVRAHQAGSHQHKGWEEFTDAVMRTLSQKREHLVFILWGRYAREKGSVVDVAKHLVIESAHPSPFAAYAGFFGSKPFSKTNAYLVRHGQPPIEW